MSNLNQTQFSAYDERPDPKRPGQQGVLFRKQAPAMDPAKRKPEKSPATGNAREVFRPDEPAYHGTSAELRERSLIRPGHYSNFPGKTHDVNAEHVYTTHDLMDAYHFAMKAAQQKGGRPRIYKVQPTGPVQVDSELRPTSAQWKNDRDEMDLTNFQSRRPLRVTGRVPITPAKKLFHEFYGTSWAESGVGED